MTMGALGPRPTCSARLQFHDLGVKMKRNYQKRQKKFFHMNQKGFVNIVLVVIIVALAGAGIYFVSTRQITPSTAIPSPSPTPISKSTAQLTPTELKYFLEDKFGKATFCGPSVEPPDSEDRLLKQFPTVAANTEEIPIILKHTDIIDTGSWTDSDKLTIVREHNRLSAISLEAFNSNYKFSIRSHSQDKEELISEGFITQSGSITTTKQEPYTYGCPICLAENTLIDTPFGVMAIQDLQKGMPIWTMNNSGLRVPAKILETVRTQVPSTHRVTHLTLDDGRELFISPGHPTGDGRTIGDLFVGDSLDGGRVITVENILYQKDFTYDILPSGETGLYWANGILTGSTLFHSN